ncbi:MAG TPA: choice-of-anchor D domain-containing protein [Solirubrobacteraceae bacterium]|nr:choice-of-anchor D domain-containing protein [Solirubrobacteraceae bacterium]
MLVRTAVLATIAPIAACALAPAAFAVAPAPATFGYTGAEQSYTVPPGVTHVRVTATGAPGGAGAPGPTRPGVVGGLGALLTGDLAVTPGELLYVEVGGAGGDGAVNGGGLGGWNGGGLGGRSFGGDGSFGGGGGGASDVRFCSINATDCLVVQSSEASRLLVAGGGGGGGAAQVNDDPGGAGGDAGESGTPGGTASGGGGGGATRAAGGAGGRGGGCAVATSSGMSGLDGGLGAGGIGGYGIAGQDDTWGGGGGGGYYGGGGGGDGCEAGGGGGGGGSSYGPAGATFGTAARGSDTPSVTITPLVADAQVSPATLSFGSQSVNTLSQPQTVTVTNTGTVPLTVSGLTFAGASAGDFFFGSWGCGGSIAPGSSCQLAVRFAPGAAGARAATLTIVTNELTGPASVHCTRRRLSSNAKFVLAPTATRGSLSRRGTVYATGVSNHGHLVLRAHRAVAAGVYTLTLAQGGHRTTTRVMVR